MGSSELSFASAEGLGNQSQGGLMLVIQLGELVAVFVSIILNTAFSTLIKILRQENVVSFQERYINGDNN